MRRFTTVSDDGTSLSNNMETTILHPRQPKRQKRTAAMTTTTAASSSSAAAVARLPSAVATSNHPPSPVPSSSSLITSLQKVDPVLQFLTRATGRTVLAAPTVRRAFLPLLAVHNHRNNPAAEQQQFWQDVQTLVGYGILHCCYIPNDDESLFLEDPFETQQKQRQQKRQQQQQRKNASKSRPNSNSSSEAAETKLAVAEGEESAVPIIIAWDNVCCNIGFPRPTLPPHSTTTTDPIYMNLHGSTKAAAKRRLAALRRRIKENDNTNAVSNSSSAAASSSSGADPSSSSSFSTTTSTTETIDGSGGGGVRTSCSTAVSARSPQLPQPVNPQETRVGATVHDSHETAVGDDGDNDDSDDDTDNEEEVVVEEFSDQEQRARKALQQLFGFETANPRVAKAKTTIAGTTTTILPGQASYAGSQAAQTSQYANLSSECRRQIPAVLLQAFDIDDDDVHQGDDTVLNGAATVGESSSPSSSSSFVPGRRKNRRLYSHQCSAIEAALMGQHCSVCTGTGSGKSLCFLLPALTAAYKHNRTSLLLFPTKALAQDQLSKLQTLLSQADGDGGGDLAQRIRPGTLDGDTSHAARGRIQNCNIILTNPDTLHAAVLPAWRTAAYRPVLAALHLVVIDEAHTYDGVFGAHVAMVLRRLVRVCAVAADNGTHSHDDHDHHNGFNNTNTTTLLDEYTNRSLTFFAASATLPWPETHFRLLCPVGDKVPIQILTSAEDGSPRSAKHFFVWNPPVLNKSDGTSTGKVHFPRPKTIAGASVAAAKTSLMRASVTGDKRSSQESSLNNVSLCSAANRNGSWGVAACGGVPLKSLDECAGITPWDEMTRPNVTVNSSHTPDQLPSLMYHRRHAADETARLLARAVANRVRCIAFCKTRNVVEWVYSKTLDVLKSDPQTAHLVSLVESYRGGYNMSERRKIEERLFKNELLGVVGTNALELGVDIGGIDLTLHCGYPSSHASLQQQAGRAGRRKDRLGTPSVSIVVCFNSPSEQQMWRRPKSLHSTGMSAPDSIPIRGDLVQGHLLCASEEFPLTGSEPVTAIANLTASEKERVRSDRELFGLNEYDEALASLKLTGSVIEEKIACSADPKSIFSVFKARPSMRKAWSRLSIRSIEPINYSVVNIAHPGQGGRVDDIHDSAAILDTLPYSRVFYHAHPGSIITHRALKYEIISMTRPPIFAAENFGYRRSLNLAAFAKPINARYLTQALSKTKITIVKQMEIVELRERLLVSSSCTSSTNAAVKTGTETEEQVLTFAGCGAVSVKREVHGYKKLSIINRSEISRTELTLPPIEYDTFGLYICTDPSLLADSLGERYGPGVHALSHALLAVAPLFAPGLTRNDLECDHSYWMPTQIILFDERAGGSGCVQRLWKCFFQPINSILEAAIDLLKECSSCLVDPRYDGGCPACLHASNCLNFNSHLSRSAAILIGERMLERIKATDLYIVNAAHRQDESSAARKEDSVDTSPRRKARQRAMEKAKEMRSARDRQFVISRPSWPGESASRQEYG